MQRGPGRVPPLAAWRRAPLAARTVPLLATWLSSQEESMLLQDGFHERAIRQRMVIHTLQEECHSTTSRILHWVQVLVPVVLVVAFVALRLL